MVTLKVEKRTQIGKRVKALRKKGIMPAVLYGADRPPLSISIPALNFKKVFDKTGTSTLIDVDITDEKDRVLITEVQKDPVSGKPIHADLKRVKTGEKMTANVPVEIVGESPVVKSGEGVLLTLIDEVEVECFPQDLPREITVDISALTEVERGITVKELPVDHQKVKILDHEEDDLVVKIDYPLQEEVEKEVTEEEAVAAVEASEERKEEEEGEEEKEEQ